MKIRLQRFMADCGVASRRECEEMIEQGRVRVNGEVKTRMPVMIDAVHDVITVDEEKIGIDSGEGLKEQAKVYLLLNKPKGILVTTFDPSDRKTVGELMVGVKERVFPVGRLDMEGRGALIMTNDGELANRLTHPRYGVEKTYIVEVDGKIGHGELEKMKRGMWLGPERPGADKSAKKSERFHVKLLGRERGRTILEVKISEGKNREIRRVMAAIGHPVRDLNRVAIAEKVTIKNLKIGAFRALSPSEVKWLFKASSPEFHGEKRAETQAWYEAKEMEKERKRLVVEEKELKLKTQNAKLKTEEAKTKKPERERPVRKGKKPFVPKTGRNAGKALGGNFMGRRRIEREAIQAEIFAEREVEGGGEEVKKTELPRHPLGDAASSEE